jgi:thiamine-monophosphate kinase
MAWDEDRLHRWLLRTSDEPDARGHDAAVGRRLAGRPVTCVDQTVEGVHFDSGAPARAVGAKAAARALSDLAATAAVPRALLCALSAPAERDERWLRDVLRGVRTAARRAGCALVGGDLCQAPGPAHVAVTALGELAGSARPPARDRLRAGDVLVLTGPVGGSRAKRHLAIRPRLAEGRWLYERGARAMMDTTDGLALDLERLARRSGVRIVLDHVPVHRDAVRAARDGAGRDALWHALHDGEDHELVAGLARADHARVVREARRAVPELATIGRAVRGAGLVLAAELVGCRRRWSPREGGFVHGR